MSLSKNFKDRDRDAFIENPLDQGTDRRVHDIITHDKLDTLITASGVDATVKITVTQKNADGAPEIIEYRDSGNVLLKTLTLTYDSDGDFQELVKS